MARRKTPVRLTKITVTVPEKTVERLDKLAGEFEDYMSRSALISDILEFFLKERELVNMVYPMED